jgi:hypothetical protein
MSFGNHVRNGLAIGLLASTFLSSRRSGSSGPSAAMSLNFLAGAPIDPRVTFTRNSTATFTDSNGLIQMAAINEPRFDYDPVTLAPKGLLIEDQQTNFLLNSTIDGASLSTQSVTVDGGFYTISFYGTGTIALTGAFVATVTGTGVYPNRQTLTFRPIAGILVCTVTGSVQYAQLEIGSFASSYIPTAASVALRRKDFASMTGANFSSWYNASEGTMVVSGDRFGSFGLSASDYWAAIDIGGFASNGIALAVIAGSDNNVAVIRSGGSLVAAMSLGVVTANVVYRMAVAYKVNDFAACRNGGTVTTDTAGAVPISPTQLAIGDGFETGNTLNGHVRSIAYYNTRLPNATLQALTT